MSCRVAALCFLSLASCGGDEEPASITRSAFFAARARAFCSQLDACCREAGKEFAAGPSCPALAKQYANVILSLDVEYDPVAGAECVAAYDQWLDDCSPVGEDAIAEACQDVFVGTRALGESCGSHLECARTDEHRTQCNRTVRDDLVNGSARETTSCGPRITARDYERVAIGEACDATCVLDSGCWDDSAGVERRGCFVEDGLQCVDRVCGPLGAEGEPCVHPSTCEPPLYCTRAATCARAPEDGEFCTPDRVCGPDSFCPEDPSNRCQPKRPDGAACVASAECSSGYCDPTQQCGRFGIVDGLGCELPTAATLFEYDAR